MCPLKVYEIDFPNTPEQKEKIHSTIPPGMSDSIMQLDITS